MIDVELLHCDSCIILLSMLLLIIDVIFERGLCEDSIGIRNVDRSIPSESIVTEYVVAVGSTLLGTKTEVLSEM